MNPVRRIVFVSALLAAAAGAQAPPEGTPAEVPQTRVRGRVVDARTRAPVKGAKVIIGSAGVIAIADGDFEGSFDISDAPSGDQQITAIKSGYSSYRGDVRVPAGRELQDVRIEMDRSAVITGRVIGVDGAPLSGADVRLLQSGYEHGTLMYNAVNWGYSDDRGIFRMWGLDPGDYVIKVDARAIRGPQGATVYESTGVYYPNASTVTDAAPVHVDWGQIQEGVDLQLGPSVATRVDGSVNFQEVGGDCSACSADLRRQEGGVWLEAGGVNIRRNVFTLLGLTTGRYVVRVQAWDRSDGSSSFGASEFVVTEERTSRVVVDMHGQQAVIGRVVLVDPPESIARPSAEPWRSKLRFIASETDAFGPLEYTGTAADVSGPGAGAAFDLKAVPGRYRFGLYPVPGDGYVRSVSVAGRPIEGVEIEVPLSGLEDMVISVAYDVGKVSGKVDMGKTPPPDVGLLPRSPIVQLVAEANQARFVERLFSVAKPDGSFEIGGLPPGLYRAFTRTEEGLRPDELENPVVARKLAPWSKQVEVRAGQTATLDLKPAPRLSELE